MSVSSYLRAPALEGPVDPTGPQGARFFRKRTLFVAALGVGFVAINALSGIFVDFDFISAGIEMPMALG